MRRLVAKTAAVLALAGTAVIMAAPADAQRGRGGGWSRGGGGWGGYRGGWRGHRGGNGAAVAFGIIGLGVGAAIASRPYYRGYGGYGYAPGGYGYGYGYAPGGFGYGVGYGYAPPPYAYGRGCFEDLRWDGWRGRYIPVRICD